MRFPIWFSISLCLITTPALGHEFWILPEKYSVGPDEPVVATLRNGQNFSGGPFGYLPPRFVRFDLVKGDLVVPVKGRIGDRPALNMPVPEPGLWVIVHETTDNLLTWDDWERFEGFVTHKDLGDTLAQHAQRGLARTGFKESYRRYAKSLVAVGDGKGSDREVGLLTEFVALTNPYTDDVSGGFRVLLLLDGLPRPDAQIEVFDKDATGSVSVTTYRTDQDGTAVISVKPGHEYLLDAVKMLPLDTDNPDLEPVWKSLWAALTFRVPE